jgi:hypothetical protein
VKKFYVLKMEDMADALVYDSKEDAEYWAERNARGNMGKTYAVMELSSSATAQVEKVRMVKAAYTEKGYTPV